jgi:hypothetical protein
MRGSGTVTDSERPKPDARPSKARGSKRDPQADARVAGLHDRIEVEADTVEWFTDRPQRRAGIAAAHALVENWKGYGFDERPPNAAVAGPGTDAVVELRRPQKTRDGISFETVGIRGELPLKKDTELSLFIDSSEWETDMHVYPYGSFCAENETSTLTNPQIIAAPKNWSSQPQASLDVVWAENEATQLFNAASTTGTTSFEVEYSAECDGQNVGSVTFKGKVPDSSSPDSFSCTENISGAKCAGTEGGGYHVQASAQFIPDWQSQSGMN